MNKTPDEQLAQLTEVITEVFMMGVGIAAADDIEPDDKDKAVLNTQRHYVEKALVAVQLYSLGIDLRARDSERNHLFSVMRQLHIDFNPKAIVKLSNEWKAIAAKNAVDRP